MVKQKTILITGASSGIGAACARQFAAAGANLILCARRINQLEEMAITLQAQHGVKVLTVKLDVQDRASVSALPKTLPEGFREIDVLINNAGLAAGFDPIQVAKIDDWEMMIDTNVKGLLYMTRALLPAMIARNSGHIINIGSIAGHFVYPNGVVYSATKHAVKALSAGLRMDLFGTKLRVTSLDPGAVHTEFSEVRFKGDKTRADAFYEGMDALTADDIADAALYCASRPAHVNISEMIIMPTDQAAATMIARKTT